MPKVAKTNGAVQVVTPAAPEHKAKKAEPLLVVRNLTRTCSVVARKL